MFYAYCLLLIFLCLCAVLLCFTESIISYFSAFCLPFFLLSHSFGVLDTVKHLISAVSDFRGSMTIIYWRILILAVMIYHGSR